MNDPTLPPGVHAERLKMALENLRTVKGREQARFAMLMVAMKTHGIALDVIGAPEPVKASFNAIVARTAVALSDAMKMEEKALESLVDDCKMLEKLFGDDVIDALRKIGKA